MDARLSLSPTDMHQAPTIPPGFEQKLRNFDSRLRVRWDGDRGVWLIEEHGHQTGVWHYVLAWAKRDATNPARMEYLALPESPDAICGYLAKIDLVRMGYENPKAYGEYMKMLEQRRLDWEKGRHEEWKDIGAQYVPDMLMRADGARETFGPGGHRSRNFKKFGSPHLRAAVAALEASG